MERQEERYALLIPVNLHLTAIIIPTIPGKPQKTVAHAKKIPNTWLSRVPPPQKAR